MKCPVCSRWELIPHGVKTGDGYQWSYCSDPRCATPVLIDHRTQTVARIGKP